MHVVKPLVCKLWHACCLVFLACRKASCLQVMVWFVVAHASIVLLSCRKFERLSRILKFLNGCLAYWNAMYGCLAFGVLSFFRVDVSFSLQILVAKS